MSPTDVFLTLMYSTVMDNILLQTNLYINQKQKSAKPVALNEFYSFLRLQFLLRYSWLPKVRMYWAADEDIAVPLVLRAMPCDRYLEILSNLLVNDNDAVPNENKGKLYKIRLFISQLNEHFLSFKLPDEMWSTDESVVLFKGCSSIK